MEVAAIAGTVLSAGSTMLGAVAQSRAMRAQAAAGQQKAAIEQDWLNRRAGEERAAAQRGAFAQSREGKLAQSRLVAMAGASGGRVDDPTVTGLWSGIEREAQFNAAKEAAAGAQKAAGLEYQGNLGVWGADAEAEIKNAGARQTLIGGLLGGVGQGLTGVAASSRMSARYPNSYAAYRYG